MATGRKTKRGKSKAPAEPEVLPPDEDDEDDEDRDESDGSSPVIELASEDPDRAGTVTSGTLPAARGLSSGGSSASLPALRGTEGVSRASPLQTFLRQIGRFPVLSAEDEHELAVKVYEHKDRAAAQQLAVHNLRLVVKMAYRYRRAWASVLDLIQEGNVGLIEAVRRFDPYKGARFSTYAAYWIRAYMLRFLLDHSRMVRISRTRAGRKMFFRLTKERQKLMALGIDATPKLLAESLGVSEKDYTETAMFMDNQEQRLDRPLGAEGDGSSTLLDTFSNADESPESAAHRRAFTEDVSKSLEAFATTLKDEREEAAWTEHLMSDDPISLSELGTRFGVTKQRMGQIVNGIRKRLKAHLLQDLGPEVELGYRIGPEP